MALAVCIAVGLSSISSSAAATDFANEPSLSESADLLRRGEFAKAAISATASAAFYKDANKHGLEIKALQLLAEAQQRLGEYRSAALNLEQALALAQQSPGKVQVASILGALGNI
ncbi:MAG: hypothetical protein GY935_26600, partial [Gammaproteobacteria bacterium]|nr:hypothetical protein [Gammaproteobacteria bacterium]